MHDGSTDLGFMSDGEYLISYKSLSIYSCAIGWPLCFKRNEKLNNVNFLAAILGE